MRPGRVIAAKSVTSETVSETGAFSATYKAGDGKRRKGETPVFWLLLLGVGKLEEPIDPNATLESRGWRYVGDDDGE